MRFRPFLFVSCSLFLLTMILACEFGSTAIGLSSLFFGADSSELSTLVVWSLRLPRVLVAALCGAGLAAAGVISQGLFRNPLADPTVIGTTSAGSLAVVLLFYLGAAWTHWLALPIAAWVGTFLCSLWVLFLFSRNTLASTEQLVLIGFAVATLCNSIASFIISLMLEEHERSAAAMRWLLGGFSGLSWQHVLTGVIPIFGGLLLARWVSTRLDLLALGEDVAISLGMDLKQLRIVSVLAISLLVGTAVSLAGGIPFVGLVVPHICRLLHGPQQRTLLLLSSVNGATLVVLADLIGRTLRRPLEVEVGILTALVGSAFFIGMLLRRYGTLNR